MPINRPVARRSVVRWVDALTWYHEKHCRCIVLLWGSTGVTQSGRREMTESWGKSWRRIIKAEYDSTCFVCKRPVHIGQAIVNDGQRWIHVRCAED